MSLFPADIEEIARRIVNDFTLRKLMVATAESCTGGLIAGALTEIAGSSAVVDRGFVTYTNEAKSDLLGVQTEALRQYGAVSRETALQMVNGALYRSRASVAVAVTGIAGPGGGSKEKPVGLVHLAAKACNGDPLHREMRYGDIGRTEIRLATVRTALEMLVEAAS
ncbi:CinA family protein [Rhizobium sp. YJ-22]|uniref:CinA family protein n=1 Tax=Rhizobium sp. YJ-22 TaxID=3037556 RepID=UPI002412D2E4|nr:CinA family protein [Rhizobium sp. YJ-22]MDG3576856.1 CinA family protein [Rhizobium sp. YJ-22]